MSLRRDFTYSYHDAYTKKALVAQKTTNCVTEIMFEESLVIPPVANWGPGIDSMNDPTCEPSLMSVKDTEITRKYMRCIHPDAYAYFKAGALIHVKTTVPTGLLAIETVSDIFARTTDLYRRRWHAGMIPPSPACKRALKQVVSALKKQGHEVVDFRPPNIWEGLEIGYQLLFSDGGQITNALSPNETISPAAKSILDLLQLPRIIKKILAFFVRSSDPMASQLYARDLYREGWHRKWTEEGLDFVLAVPHSFPVLENGTSEQTTLTSAGYALLFNLLDYTAGVLPVTFVEKTVDDLPQDFIHSEVYKSYNAVARTAYSVYNVEKMHGLPLGVQ
ncbi:amidase signature enzyme [Phlegmacium glaucopus]|nr:amidase signature enzyme [Phlegmacium glaucopus]